MSEKERVQLTLHASNLKNVAGAFKGTSDPFAIVTLLASGPGEKPKVLGKTEVVKNTLSPNWTTSFIFDYEIGKETHLNVSVVDEVRKNNDKAMGSAVFEIGDILGSRGCIKAKKLKKGGTLFARIQKAAPISAGKLALRLRGIKLKNVEGLFKKSDPFYELRRTYDGPGGGTWRTVFRSKHVKNDLNPRWEPATVDINALCDGNLDKGIQVAIFDHESDGKHETMGTFETNVNALVNAAFDKKTFTPKKGTKSYGTVAVDECKITGVEKPSAPVNTAALNPAASPPPSSAAADPSVVPIPIPVSQFGNMSLGSSSSCKKPTFVDYISGHCDLNMCVAIDFTGSNGDPRRPGTLHHFYHDGRFNDYEKAISAVGGILSKYDSNQRFPVWGFGAKYDGVVRHCFQVGTEKEVHGVRGILDAYKAVFRTPLTMSGPTVFSEVIALAASQARTSQQMNPLSYTILLLLTDGAVTDVQATKQSLMQVADAPLSIVIVGIGQADFTAMQFLDDFEKRSNMNRDIVQFVQFNAHQHDKTSLTRATLEEIPNQLVQFFHARGIMPRPSANTSAYKIVADEHNEDTDIDLSMDYNADGEIVLTGDQSAAFVDNSYEAGIGRLNPIPPPVAPPTSHPHSASATSIPSNHAQYASAQQPFSASSPPVITSAVPPPFTFQIQVPPGIAPGMQLQVQHPQTGQMLVVVVPQGVSPGGLFTVSA